MEQHAGQAPESPPNEVETYTAEYQLRLPSFDEAPTIYSNIAQASLTQHDMTLFFGWYASPPLTSRPPDDPIDVPVRPLLSVSIPLGTVRALVRMLEAQIAVWEKSTGRELPPPNPPGIAADNEGADA